MFNKKLKLHVLSILFGILGFADASFAGADYPNPIITCEPIVTENYHIKITVSTDVEGSTNKAAAILINGTDSSEASTVIGTLDDDVKLTFNAKTKYTRLKVTAETRKPYGSTIKLEFYKRGSWRTVYDGKAECKTRQYESIGVHNLD